jgi:hypothetical protein
MAVSLPLWAGNTRQLGNVLMDRVLPASRLCDCQDSRLETGHPYGLEPTPSAFTPCLDYRILSCLSRLSSAWRGNHPAYNRFRTDEFPIPINVFESGFMVRSNHALICFPARLSGDGRLLPQIYVVDLPFQAESLGTIIFWIVASSTSLRGLAS